MLLVEDRIPGQWRYVLSRGPLMLVPDEIRKCVVFLTYRGQHGYYAAGTAFFIADALEGTDKVASYLVTAKHVIDGIRANAIDQRVYVRINTHSEGAKLVETRLDLWRLASQDVEATDVAVLPWAPQGEVFDFRQIPLAMFALQEQIDAWGFGVGDEVFFPGLFINHYGQERNIPIVRTGTIAAMPEEPVQTDLGPMRAYLIEARSIGGLSGSPVFVHGGAIRENPATGDFQMLKKTQFLLLGIIQGHWGVRDMPKADALTDEAVNMGIGIAVPVQAVIDLLKNDPDIAKQREQMLEHLRSASLPILDAASQVVDHGVTRDEFLRDLGKVTRPVEPTEQASS